MIYHPKKVVIKKVLFFGSFLLLIGILILMRSEPKELSDRGSQFNPTPAAEETILVKKIIDGDTIVLEDGEVVRYIGIDAPETSQKTSCFADEASRKNKELVGEKRVRLERDVSEKDKHQRLLRYVYVGDLFVNDYLVRNGYGRVSTYPPDVKYQQQFLESEKYARENKLGLWSGCSLSPSQSLGTQAPSPSLSSPSNLNLNLDVDCSSNRYNCSDFKTQAEAQEVFEYCGGMANDIHRLDRDRDDRVCESLP